MDPALFGCSNSHSKIGIFGSPQVGVTRVCLLLLCCAVVIMLCCGYYVVLHSMLNHKIKVLFDKGLATI